ncbi:MAG TPA: hypothetical protein VK427_04875, partial [Kofleriaceae bacterium]|nr:hypothetical protein [Kofleriaceae bacterium]
MRTNLALVALGIIAAVEPARAACIPGFDYALFAVDGIDIQGAAGTDSYDSASGTYATMQSCSDSDIGTNATGSGKIHVQSNSTQVCGDAVVGAGGVPATVITGNGNITGGKSAQTTNTALPDVTLPSLAAGSPFTLSTSNANTTLVADRTYGDISCKNGSLTLQTGKYVVKSLTLTSQCELIVSGGPIEVYFTSSLDMQAGVVSNSSNIPSNLIFFGSATATTAEFQGGVDSAFAIYAPKTTCSLQGNVDVFGAFICKSVSVQGNADVHYDRSLANFAASSFTCPVKEVSRATPIAATIGGQPSIVQGTFEVPTLSRTSIAKTADITSFSFPYLKGHMRARVAASITTAGSSYASGTVQFDAGASGKIPTASLAGCTTFDGTCRNVFTVTQTPTSTGTSFHPPRVQLNSANASTIGALIAPASAVAGITATH